jgi:hypothetical protein
MRIVSEELAAADTDMLHLRFVRDGDPEVEAELLGRHGRLALGSHQGPRRRLSRVTSAYPRTRLNDWFDTRPRSA